jgi:2-methylcitrate dehydratase PrpD
MQNHCCKFDKKVKYCPMSNVRQTSGASDNSVWQHLAELKWQEIPEPVRRQTKRCIKDILATAAGATILSDTALIADLISEQFKTGPAPMWFQKRRTAFLGAAFFNAFLTDSLDCHDGFRPCKGHAGATVVPAILSAAAGYQAPGSELLMCVLIGYEVACRAGIAIHAEYSPAYHSSGSWASLGAAAGAARIRNINSDKFDEIMGIAEYYAPMSPMLRCTRHPAAVKDGAAAGAWAAAMAMEMVGHGFGGLPSLLTAEPSASKQMASFGKEWIILRQYFKPYPTCRWTHPVIEAVAALKAEHHFDADQIDAVKIETFREAMTLDSFPPADTHTAQYSMPWAVAAFLVDGSLGVQQVHTDKLTDKRILELGRKIKMVFAQDIQDRFPQQCLARVTVTLKGGERFVSPTTAARGDPETPLTDEQLDSKFNENVTRIAGADKCIMIGNLIADLENHTTDELLELL